MEQSRCRRTPNLHHAYEENAVAHPQSEPIPSIQSSEEQVETSQPVLPQNEPQNAHRTRTSPFWNVDIIGIYVFT